MTKGLLLFKAFFRRQRGSVLGLLLLFFLISTGGFTALTLSVSGERSVAAEMDRLGFGTLTVWVNGGEAMLAEELEVLPDVERVTVQPLIFTGYQIGGVHSDNEGQLIVYDGSVPYRFVDEQGEPMSIPEVVEGTVYISPAMRSSYDVSIGDTVSFELSRSGGIVGLTVAGYFEDAFMGSAMIDMKSFLISSADGVAMGNVIDTAADYDVLGRWGAMLHLFRRADSALTDAEFSRLVHTSASLSEYTEFTYSGSSILSYMLLLQNILTGFLLVFSGVLLVICLIVMSHSLSAAIAQSRHDMAVMKTLGLSSMHIRGAYMALYGGCVLIGTLMGLVPARLMSQWLAHGMLTSTGMLIEVQSPMGLITGILMGLLLFFVAVLYLRTAKIMAVTPMQTMQRGIPGKQARTALSKRFLCFSITVRELACAKRKYVGIGMIAVLLTVFLSVVGRMGAWLGPNGDGLMNAFSVAAHDLGVQPLNDAIDMAEIEAEIGAWSPIAQRYELAMEGVTVNGQAYTANVLDDPAWFHLLEGALCGEDDILITHTVAGELGLSIGDTVRVAGGRSAEYTVSGIYQCANGMGANIGMSREGYAKIGNVDGFIWCRHYLLEDGSEREAMLKHLQDSYRGIDVHTNSWSGLDGIVQVMRLLIGLIYGVSALFIFIAVCLSSSKLLTSEIGNMAIYKSLGLSSSKLRLAFALRFLLVVTLGAALGAGLSAFFADSAIRPVFRLFGIGAFASRPGFLGTALPPLAVAALFFGFAWLFSARIARISLVKCILENDE